MQRRLTRTLILLVALTCTGLAGAAPDAPTGVFIVHGVPGQDLALDPNLPVDVLVDDTRCLLESLTFGEIVGPVALPAGTYNLKISLANESAPCTDTPVIDTDVTLATGDTTAIVAHLDAGGTAVASSFPIDRSPTGLFRARVILHHVADAPDVDVSGVRRGFYPRTFRADGVSYLDQADEVVLAGYWDVAVAEAGVPSSALDPVRLKVRPFRIVLVFAVGSVDDGSFRLLSGEVRPYFSPQGERSIRPAAGRRPFLDEN